MMPVAEEPVHAGLFSKLNPVARLLKAFWQINLGKVQDKRLQVFEPQASFVIA